MHDYSYKPPPVFHGVGPLFLGVEIEVETPDSYEQECAEIANEYLGDLGYLKQDGTIINGFEIVTHPMSYEWALANFPWHMLTELGQAGCEATSNTGIHVHVARAALDSPCHIYRWMKLIYRNQPEVEMVARRSAPDWAAFTADDRQAVKHYAKGIRGHDRYRAINTNNRDTFEVRVFASSLDPGEVKAALAFTAGSVEYTRRLSIARLAAGAWEWPAFTAWLAEQPDYQPLTDQLEALACAC
ncbi:MAG: hypothetical protein ACRDT6_19830 [Micromonosporaceae bacterium]